ncbi:MAG: exonuclease domain-containing protein, partial [Suilimivivens sp.]
MAKQFFDVFPNLKLDKKNQDLFEQTIVEKVSATKSRDLIRVTFLSEHLIRKENVLKVEEEIKKQFFANHSVRVKLYERFKLSGQYTPEKLMNVYKDSILLELRNYSPVEYNVFKGADLSFPSEQEMELTVEDTVLARSKVDELVRILEKILNERCGFSTRVSVGYKEKKNGKYKEEDDLKIARQVAEIASRVHGTLVNEEAVFEEDAKGREEISSQEGFPSGKNNEGTDKTEMVKASKDAAPDGGKTSAQGSVSAFGNGSARKGFKKGEFRKGDFKKGEFNRSIKRSDNPDVLYGRDFEEEAIPIEEVIGDIGEVVIRGKIIHFDSREIKNEKTILMFDITDFTDTMTIKMFARNDQVAEITAGIKVGAFVKLKGVTMVDKFDNELTIGSLMGIKKIPDFTTSRSDNSARKRVELHCHTKMSDMDGVSEARDIVKRAYKWGHPAIAITDHGVVQSFPDANHVWEDLWKEEKNRRKEAGDKNPDKQDFFKIIYGMEAYLVDDLKEIVTGDAGQDFTSDFVVFDIETTGFSPVNNRIIEIGAVKVSGGAIVERYSTFVNPGVPIPFEIEKLTGINDSMVMDSPSIEIILPEFLSFCRDAVMVAHNANFDMSFIMENAQRLGIKRKFTYVDTLGIARILLPHQAKHTLDAVAKTLGISLENHHRAVDDAECTAEIFVKFIPMLKDAGADTLAKVNAMGASSPDIVKKLTSYHAIIL